MKGQGPTLYPDCLIGSLYLDRPILPEDFIDILFFSHIYFFVCKSSFSLPGSSREKIWGEFIGYSLPGSCPEEVLGNFICKHVMGMVRSQARVLQKCCWIAVKVVNDSRTGDDCMTQGSQLQDAMPTMIASLHKNTPSRIHDVRTHIDIAVMCFSVCKAVNLWNCILWRTLGIASWVAAIQFGSDKVATPQVSNSDTVPLRKKNAKQSRVFL